MSLTTTLKSGVALENLLDFGLSLQPWHSSCLRFYSLLVLFSFATAFKFCPFSHFSAPDAFPIVSPNHWYFLVSFYFQIAQSFWLLMVNVVFAPANRHQCLVLVQSSWYNWRFSWIPLVYLMNSQLLVHGVFFDSHLIFLTFDWLSDFEANALLTEILVTYWRFSLFARTFICFQAEVSDSAWWKPSCWGLKTHDPIEQAIPFRPILKMRWQHRPFCIPSSISSNLLLFSKSSFSESPL